MTGRMASLLALAEMLQKALKAQAQDGQDHARAHQSLEDAHASLGALLAAESPLVLTTAGGRIHFQGEGLEGGPQTVQALARELEARGIGGLVFHRGVDPDELQLLFFALQLKPQRLLEMGGPRCLLPDDGHLRVLDPEEGPPAPGDAAAPPERIEALPHLEGPLPPVALADELRRRFAHLIQTTAAPPKRTFHMPWTSEHREVLKKHGLRVPDFGGMEGTGEALHLGMLDSVSLREVLRTALSLLPPLEQGSVLLGMATFPGSEQALRRGLDYLGPELLAQAVAHAHITGNPSRFELALLVASLLQCVKDRELSLESIRGRLQFEGWGLHEVDQLREAILWECQGTDTKMQQALADRSIFELDPQQVMILLRQLVRGRRFDSLKDLLRQLEAGLASPQPQRRCMAAEIAADLAECLEEPGLPADLEAFLHRLLHEHLDLENEDRALLWTCQGLESLFGHWIRAGNFEGVHQELLSLGGISFQSNTAPGKRQAIKELLSRVGSPPNMACLTLLLHDPGTSLSRPKLHALLALLGRPAAQYLAACLDLAEDPDRTAQLMAGLRAIGRSALPCLRDLLASDRPETLVRTLALLGDLGQAEAAQDAAALLGHRDLEVRSAAVATLGRLGGGAAAAALAASFPGAPPALQLAALDALTPLKDPCAVPALSDFLRDSRGSDLEVARVRLRVVETLGLLGSPLALPALLELFKKKGFLGGRESTGIRLAAARAMAALPGREAREALALALDGEKEEEVRSALRQYLVGGGS